MYDEYPTCFINFAKITVMAAPFNLKIILLSIMLLFYLFIYPFLSVGSENPQPGSDGIMRSKAVEKVNKKKIFVIITKVIRTTLAWISKERNSTIEFKK